MTIPSDILVLFLSSFLAATLLPVQSELVLALVKNTSLVSVWALVGVATFGNVLGALVNWFLGRFLMRFRDAKWFPVAPKVIQKYTPFYDRFGIWTLLLAWVPIIGDPLTFLAGIFRANIWLFIFLVTIGKAGRYILVVLIV